MNHYCFWHMGQKIKPPSKSTTTHVCFLREYCKQETDRSWSSSYLFNCLKWRCRVRCFDHRQRTFSVTKGIYHALQCVQNIFIVLSICVARPKTTALCLSKTWKWHCFGKQKINTNGKNVLFQVLFLWSICLVTLGIQLRLLVFLGFFTQTSRCCLCRRKAMVKHLPSKVILYVAPLAIFTPKCLPEIPSPFVWKKWWSGNCCLETRDLWEAWNILEVARIAKL